MTQSFGQIESYYYAKPSNESPNAHCPNCFKLIQRGDDISDKIDLYCMECAMKLSQQDCGQSIEARTHGHSSAPALPEGAIKINNALLADPKVQAAKILDAAISEDEMRSAVAYVQNELKLSLADVPEAFLQESTLEMLPLVTEYPPNP